MSTDLRTHEVPATRTTSYGEVVASHGVTTRTDGVWTLVGEPALEYGWKLHISGVQVRAIDLLDAVVPVLAEHRVPFKVARDAEVLGLLNEGALGDTQVGKFMTVYSDELPVPRRSELARALVRATEGFDGPRVVTDAHIGGQVYCRYGEFRPGRARNRLGVFAPAGGDGSAQAAYTVPFEPPEGIDGAQHYGVRPDTSSDQWEAIGPGYLPVRTLTARAKGAVLVAIDLREGAEPTKVILKQGRPGCMSDEQGRDMRDRLRHQAEIHRVVRGRLRTPEVGEPFVHEGLHYLPMQYVEGEDLADGGGTPLAARPPRGQRHLVDVLIDAVGELGRLHATGVVHRDLSPGNIRVGEDGVVHLMDLELAHVLGDEGPSFVQGTPGYVSPQQLRAEPADPRDDVFSVGAVVASSLTGLPGTQLEHGVGRDPARLARLSGAPPQVCRVVARCLAVEREDRPELDELAAALRAVDTPVTRPAPSRSLERTEQVIRRGVDWLLHDAPTERSSGMWVSPALEGAHERHRAVVSDQRLYRSAGRGVAGIVHTLAELHAHGLVEAAPLRRPVEAAADWLLAHHDTPDDQLPGLYYGEAGVAVALARCIDADLLDVGAWTRPYFDEVVGAAPDWPDLTHGAAGQGLAALTCASLLDRPELAAAADRYADHLVDTQRDDGSWLLPEGVEGMAGAYTGFAHGSAGIVFFLARMARIRGHAAAGEAADRGAAWLLDQASPAASGASLTWPMADDDPTVWHWWCHGAPGVGLAFLERYRWTGDEDDAGVARACLRTNPWHVRASNLSHCHGLAGWAETLLEGHEVLGDPELLDDARQVAGVLEDLAMDAGSGVAWRVESPHYFDADLLTGGAGILHLLARLARPTGTRFGLPLIDG